MTTQLSRRLRLAPLVAARGDLLCPGMRQERRAEAGCRRDRCGGRNECRAGKHRRRQGPGNQDGPALSGSLSPETQSTVRAEVSGAVLQTYVDVGATVRQGQDLARLDDSGIRDLLSRRGRA